MLPLLLLSLLSKSAALNLTVSSSGGNTSSTLQYGLLFEDIYHSGDGGLYGEMIRNRAFQGSSVDGVVSLDRTTDFWTEVGGVTLSVDTETTPLSSSLPAQLRMEVPEDTTTAVGFYNDGFWGFDVDASQRYIASMYVYGNYTGDVTCYFYSTTSDTILGSTTISLDQTESDGWVQTYSPTFYPTTTASNANNTFYFVFEDGAQLAGESLYFNVLSVFKQTYNNRANGLRTDMAEAVAALGTKYIRLPGGNNMEGLYAPYYWKWNETLGSLTERPGRPGTWGDYNTDGFGLIEMMLMADDMGLEVILGVWAGLYLDGTVVAEADLQPYVDSVMDELEFLLGDSSTTYGAQREALGYGAFTINYIEIGNEDYLNGGTTSYDDYRFTAFYDAIHATYPDISLISTINPSPVTTDGSPVDLHLYGDADYFVTLFNAFDQASRSYPVFVNEYAATNTGSNSASQIGAQTLSMACAEAVFLLGCERNSDVVVGSAYGALIKNYNEAPDTVAVIKQTASEVLYSMSFYVQQLFAANMGSSTLPVTATDGELAPVYWSATTNTSHTILKLVNYDGETGADSAVSVTLEGSSADTATLISFSAPEADSINNLAALGGETSSVTTTALQGEAGVFTVEFSSAYEILILVA
ncbi:hypothetical protein ASPZODRAFT_160113 [Penicilliopsis zonata CBS 506.65]|uniref:non-reducing end alpha-L-arabinofuranosidase n=1 Tax=Penicilliopsis zonata CBS 506.65 TaxID=1073090 RepID=A0A1L9SFF9_9EURO|nr:hypothetical protein ASPZODRAFT_160113 [Penicilliopsis zonata CBS 506.65]OJJ45936.1 hypothetical protein ASPZODRAFT_160113 [Penicilliopsis zonata CBS 506.65]